ncbi:MAG: DUF1553 domain-containing protein [Gemmataceae bacterium]|nr:DUF1553 domain-containing protein [Gemmataceae bacterium]
MLAALFLLTCAPPEATPRFFRPVLRPAIPANGGANPIDAFIRARLAKEGLDLNAPAAPAALLRRVAYDLTGLPPSPEEQDRFLSDDRPDRFERLVERLLASPAFGERWAMHWLDLVRYAESDGFNQDALRPEAHRYRDWVIRALNADLPYSDFMRKQLAGEGDDLVATGFLRLWPDEHNAAQLEQRWQEILDDTTDAVGTAFLGLTLGCARCHDHKYDPVSQKEYFRLQSFFAGMIPKEVPLGDRAALARWEKETQAIREEMEKIARPEREKESQRQLMRFHPGIREAVLAKKRTPYQEQIARMAVGQMERGAAGAHGRLTGEAKKKYAELEKRLPPRPPSLHVLAVVEVEGETPATRRLVGGDWRKPAGLVTPGFPAALGGEVGKGDRRKALAAWLSDPRNPLPARVAANRLWQHLTGRGIVSTPADFGTQGAAPTHPELLDWLAAELVAVGWRLKPLVRLIVLSETYRQSSFIDPERHERALKIDKGDDLLWRMRRRRLEGEAIRDAVLSVSGGINRAMFGLSARPVLPAGAGRMSWTPDKQEKDRDRRSVYVLARRNLRFPMFDAFDQPDLCQPCAARMATTTAPQALSLLNGDLTREQSKRWAAALAERSDPISDAYRAAWGRAPDAEETGLAQAFLAKRREKGASTADALAAFCRALFNTSEFCHVD